MKRFTFSEILILIVVTLTSLVILIVLGLWTLSVSRKTEEETLKKALTKVVETKGEKELLEMAGIPTSEIYYGEELIDLYESNDGAWNYTKEEVRNIAIYNKCSESVVQIIPQSELANTSQGSGVIVSSDGYIVTNYHVVSSSTKFSVIFYDDSRSDASIVGYDTLSDIAVLKTDKVGLKKMEMGSSLGLRVGQSVFALGNPFGYTWSLTSGMVSGLNRMVFTENNASVIPNMIQTDALINPGNSGGPLIDSMGRMVGLISSIYTTSGTAQGISFALPIETVISVASSIIKDGKLSRGCLDALTVELNAQLVAYSKLAVDKGILVSQVVPSGKADRGGLKGGNEKAKYGNSVIYLNGDIIIKIGDKDITSYTDYFSALFNTHAGDKVNITVIRNGQRVELIDVELVEQTEENSKWILR